MKIVGRNAEIGILQELLAKKTLNLWRFMGEDASEKPF